ncbi:hypothetical protein [Alicyclobacillus shizuokensis]|uniref:hypothetical protein n=1 Tax=Alicyclobacillus shizuokensis TaxID=392014 RepID=UPI0008337245|nr:hypothetical protein [Alicyclobacillus shizuokensis]
MFNRIAEIIKANTKVEVKAQTPNGAYPVIVTDASESITKGWSLTYYPRLYTQGNPRLYDGKETFSALRIANFTPVYNEVLSLDQRFRAGDGVQQSQRGAYAVYEYPGVARFSVRQNQNSVSVNMVITDERSPFYMLMINFKVTDSKSAPGQRHLIGSDAQWDANTDTFVEHNAQFAPSKARFLRIHQESREDQPKIRALVTGMSEQGALISTENAEIVYLQPISSKYAAMAYIVEQEILEHALAEALKQLQAQAVQPPAQANTQPQSQPSPLFAGMVPNGTGNNPFAAASSGQGQPNASFGAPQTPSSQATTWGALNKPAWGTLVGTK